MNGCNIINVNIVKYIFVLLMVFIFIGVYFFVRDIFSINFIKSCITTSVLIMGILVYLFNRFFWKFKIFYGNIVLIPDLNGIWEGIIESNWINPDTKEKIPPIKAKLKIKQTLFHISCKMETKEMKSNSIIAGYIIDKDNQIMQLCYIYTSKPLQTIQDRSRIHDGTVIFDIEEKRLIGNYWTGRNTSGTIKMEWTGKI